MPDDLDKARAKFRTELTLEAIQQLGMTMPEAADAMQHVRWRDIDLDAGIVRLPRHLPDLPPEATAAIQRRAAEMSDNGGMLFDSSATTERDHESDL